MFWWSVGAHFGGLLVRTLVVCRCAFWWSVAAHFGGLLESVLVVGWCAFWWSVGSHFDGLSVSILMVLRLRSRRVVLRLTPAASLLFQVILYLHRNCSVCSLLMSYPHCICSFFSLSCNVLPSPHLLYLCFQVMSYPRCIVSLSSHFMYILAA